MTDTASITTAVHHAALAAAADLPLADILVPGVPLEMTGSPVLEQFAGVAVSARFTGSHHGEVIVAVEQTVADALLNSPIGALDITAALAPALNSAAATVGTVVTGPGQSLPLGPALNALLSKPHAAVVPLMHDGVIRAVIGLAVSPEDSVRTELQVPSYPTRADLDQHRVTPIPAFTSRPVTRHGLDMLRAVAREVTAQIGSTRMTVSETRTSACGSPRSSCLSRPLPARRERSRNHRQDAARPGRRPRPDVGAGAIRPPPVDRQGRSGAQRPGPSTTQPECLGGRTQGHGSRAGGRGNRSG
ncbi:MAG: fliN, partial [Frankiales bacterium]|nr:fliN [Frankiales bacterium]